MVRRPHWSMLLAALCLSASVPAQDTVARPPPVELYDYDASLPLNTELRVHEETDEWTVHHLTYDSPKGGRVPALLGIPKSGEAPYPLVVIQHGLTGNKDVDYVHSINLALAEEGYATLRIDAQYHGERAREEDKGKFMETFYALLMDGGWVQTIADQRRGIDYCESRTDVDCERIGYVGISMGAMMGGTTCGVDERIDAAVLIVGGAFGAQANERSFALDPATFMPLMSPRPVLMLNGKNDDLVKPASAERLFAAAKEPKRIVWYDTGHWVPPDKSWREISAFMAEHVRGAR